MAIVTPLDQLSEAAYKKRIRSWTMYDWANSAFATTIMAAVLPAYYSAVAGSNLSSAATATQYWSMTNLVSMLIVALISPILGTVSDIMRGKKKFLSFFVMLGVIGTGLMVFVDTGDWMLASLLFVIGRVGFASANVFYDALLPHVAKEKDQDRVSTQGYAFGYLGGGLLLAINIAMIFTMDGNWGPRFAFLSVAIWWAVFSIPIFRNVPEPEGVSQKLKEGEKLIKVSFQKIAETVKEISQFKDLFKFLISFLIYNDGIGIIITVAVIYGAELGFGTIELVLAILLVQFVGIPYSLVFGNLPSQGDKRQPAYLAFVVFSIVVLPVMGVLSMLFLPQDITGTPSDDFAATGQYVGQGVHLITEDAFMLEGNWEETAVSGDLRGENCAWYAFSCDEADFERTYSGTSDPNTALEFTFNGQAVEAIYSVGPDGGIWLVEMDGAALLDSDGEPVQIDSNHPSARYEMDVAFQAEGEGEHTLRLVNSDGSSIAVSQVEVMPPLRTSNLGIIVAMLFGLAAVGVIFALLTKSLFVGFANKLDTKNSIMLALSAYAIVAVWGFFLDSVVEFWFLAWMIAVVQGGSQALSRSLYASMTPKSMSGEFFGFFSIMSKFASFLSPIVFIVSVAIFGSSRPAILSLIVFFGVGMFLLRQVDVERGKAVAKAKEAEIQAAVM